MFLSLFWTKLNLSSPLSKVKQDCELNVLNNNRISKGTIITYGKIELGKNYSQDELNEVNAEFIFRNKKALGRLKLKGDRLMHFEDKKNLHIV